jgi:hypothetical protein
MKSRYKGLQKHTVLYLRKTFDKTWDTNQFQVREKTIGWRHYFYIINKKPDSLTVKVTFSSPFFLLFDLVDRTMMPTFFSRIVTLEPFELRSYFIFPPWVQITNVTSL